MKSRQFIALTLCVLVANLAFAAETRTTGYTVKYSGGSLPTVKGGDDLKLFVDSEKVRLLQNKTDALNIPVSAITELSYGQEVHRRIGTAAGLAILSFGIGALVA